ncbi:hypothetical protein L1N85_17360 [Paenibacillus alkaliterrae]|uniref:hypothetical protein n=1 Tax=Paenibacillus alkaliterrae TaxID=320909 RepID=UPI001F1B2309|nr:hypothetical protein [Paenibacillus alkaliterrae]MCF2940175.1 hypothetical protein [Paenibacillus alkaliterrae]
MKKSVMVAAVAIACLTAFSFAPTVGREYAPVEQSPDLTTAFIDQVEKKENRYVLTIDSIEWYEGEQAVRKFLEREGDGEMEGPPDGYYIIDDDADLKDLPIAGDAEVFMQIYNRTGNILEADIVWDEQISVDKFVELIQTEDDLNIKGFPYHLTVKDGEIVRIVQQYIP